MGVFLFNMCFQKAVFVLKKASLVKIESIEKSYIAFYSDNILQSIKI